MGLFRGIFDRLLGFDVFISYAWSDGRAYAEGLRDALRAKQLRVFLDDERLTVGDALHASIGRALRRSSSLVVVVSGAALRSGHVANELRRFHRLGRPIIPIVDAGGVQVLQNAVEDGQAIDSLPEDASSASETLCYRANIEILRQRIWLTEPDILHCRTPSDQALDRIKLAIGRMRKQHWQQVAVGLVALVFAGLALVAELQRREAVEQRSEAERQRHTAEQNERIATSRRLAAQSRSSRDEELDLSLLLALAARDVAATEESSRALLEALNHGPPISQYLRPNGNGGAGQVLGLRNEQGFVSIDAAGQVVHWGPDGKRLARQALAAGGHGSWRMVEMAGQRLAIADGRGQVYIIRLKGLAIEERLESYALVKGGADLAWRQQTGELYVAYSSFLEPGKGAIMRWFSNDDGEWDMAYVGDLQTAIMAMVISPDGRYLAIASDIGIIGLLDLEADSETIRLRVVRTPSTRQPEVHIKALGFTPDGQWLAHDDGDGRVLLTPVAEFEDSESIGCHRHVNDVYQLAVSEDGRQLTSVGSDARLRIARLVQGRCEAVADYQATGKSLQSLALLDDHGQRLITGGGGGALVVWNLAQHGLLGRGTKAGFTLPAAIAFEPGAEQLIVAGMAGAQGFAQAFDTATLQARGEGVAGLAGPVSTAFFRPGDSGAWLVTARGITAWPELGAPETKWLEPAARQQVFWPGRLYAAGADRVALVNRSGEVSVRERQSNQLLWQRSLVEFALNPRSVAFSADGRRLAVGGTDGRIVLLDGNTGSSLGEPLVAHSLEVTGMVFGKQPGQFISGSADGRLLVWQLADGSRTSLENPYGAIQQIAVSATGELLAAATQRGEVGLWRMQDQARLGRLNTGMSTAITALDFNGSGDILAAAAIGGDLARWSVAEATWRELACGVAARRLAASERRQYSVPTGIDPCTTSGPGQDVKPGR